MCDMCSKVCHYDMSILASIVCVTCVTMMSIIAMCMCDRMCDT